MYSWHTAECKSYTRQKSSTKTTRNEGIRQGEGNTRKNKGYGAREAKPEQNVFNIFMPLTKP
jgi:hypothetical protein